MRAPRPMDFVPVGLLALLAFVATIAHSAPAGPRTTRPRATRAPAVAPLSAPAPATRDTLPPPAAAAPAGDDAMILQGGQEGTVFKTLTIEGEDRVQVEFERPALQLDLDPAAVPGLDLGTARDVLDRTQPDRVTPLLAVSTADVSPYLARPWLERFGSGAVVRFRPATRDVERWRLLIVDSRGRTVRTFEGRGRPPEEIDWDGRCADGSTAVPGLTYSYAFEAYDRAGNRRNLVGPGFGVSAFSFDTPQGPVLVFAGRLLGEASRRGGSEATPAIVLETASRLAQTPAALRPVRVTTVARSREQAADLSARVVRGLAAQTPGDPARIQAVERVEADAPEGGVVRVAPADAR